MDNYPSQDGYYSVSETIKSQCVLKTVQIFIF